jgi:signal peptidase I
VVVFHFPPDPAINYIKRLVGLPGDRVEVRNDQLVINGVPVPLEGAERFDDGCYHNMRLLSETLGTHRHAVLACRSPIGLQPPETIASCNRPPPHNYQCVEPDGSGFGEPDFNDHAEMVVPPGHYLMIGDNRDNSSDGRVWGFVPENYLVGRAARIWLNWDFQRSGGPIWSRIGRSIN